MNGNLSTDKDLHGIIVEYLLWRRGLMQPSVKPWWNYRICRIRYIAQNEIQSPDRTSLSGSNETGQRPAL
jgi:hypothetical protein